MVTTAFVNIWGKLAGAVAWNPATQVADFEFDKTFINTNNWDLSPIMMPARSSAGKIYTFPELRNSTTFRGLPGLLADLLPDKYGNALINTWLTRQGRPTGSLNPVELLCFIGIRGMGAIEIEPSNPKTHTAATKVELKSMVETAEAILSGRQNFLTHLDENEEKALVDVLKIGTSAGGARAKAVIAYNSVTGEIRSGQANVPQGFEHWLIKFDGVTDKQFGASGGYGRVEMAYYEMARDAGIEMTECRLLEENGRAHFMTRRFDRDAGNEKRHIQTFCAMRHFDFNEVEFYSYEQLFETMRMLGLPYPYADQLYKRMVFNVSGRNCDDHTKNFSFMMDKNGKWTLSPAYDVCHAYRPGSEWVSQHALSINGKRKDITKEDLLAVGYQMNIKKPEHIIRQTNEVISQWNMYAGRSQVEPVLRDAIGKTLIHF